MTEPTALLIEDYHPNTEGLDSIIPTKSFIEQRQEAYHKLLDKYDFKHGIFGSSDDYLARAVLLANDAGSYEQKNHSIFRRDEIWLAPKEEGKHIFVKGSKRLIGLVNPKLSVFQVEELKKLFFKYANVDSAKTPRKKIGDFMYEAQIIITSLGFAVATGYFSSQLGEQPSLEETFFRPIGIAGASFSFGRLIGEIGKYLSETAKAPKFSPKAYSGLEVYRVKKEHLEDFFREKFSC